MIRIRGMRWGGHVVRMGEECLEVDGRIMLKSISKEYDGEYGLDPSVSK
jgi:hypothetical protein